MYSAKRLFIVAFLVALACEGSLANINTSNRFSESLKPEQPNKDDVGFVDLLKSALDFDVNQAKLPDNPATEKLFQALGVAFRLAPMVSNLEQQVSDSFEKIANQTGQIPNRKGSLRLTLHSLIDQIPEYWRESFLHLWHSSLTDQPELALILPLPADVRESELPDHMQEESDTLWNILEEIVDVVFPFTEDSSQRGNALWKNVELIFQNRETTQIEPCEVLKDVESTGMQFFDRVLKSRSIKHLRAAVSEAKMGVAKLPGVSRKSRILCFSPTGDPEDSSIAYFAKQVVSLPLFRKVFDSEEISSEVVELTKNLLLHIGDKIETNETKGTITNFLELEASTEPQDESKKKEKQDKAFTSSKVLSPSLLVQVGCLIFCAYLHVNIHSFDKFVLNDIISGSNGTGMDETNLSIFQGRTIDEIALSSGLAISIAFAVAQIVGILLFRSVKHKAAFHLMKDLAANVTAFELQRKHRTHGEEVENSLQELDEQGESRKKQMEAISLCCEKEGMSEGFCPLFRAFVSGHEHKMNEIIHNLKNGQDMHGHEDSVARGRQQVIEQRLFDAFFHVKGSHVPTDVVAAKLMQLGLSDEIVSKALSEADPSNLGQVNFKQFSAKFLGNGDQPTLVDGLREGRFMSRAFGILILAMLVLFSVGDEVHTWVGLVALITWAIGSTLAVAMATTGRAMLPVMRQQRDLAFEHGLQKIVRALSVLALFFLIYLFLLRTCGVPTITCPNSPSVEPAIIMQCEDPNVPTPPQLQVVCDELSSLSEMCAEDVLSFEKSTCGEHIKCSYRNRVPFWDVRKDLKPGSNLTKYAVAQYNNQWEIANRGSFDESSFSRIDGLAEELEHREVPAISPGCVEQAMPAGVSDLSKVARARNGMVENILDFGAITGEKYVHFVPFAADCPNTNPVVDGGSYFVTSRVIGPNPQDMAYHVYGQDMRRFHVTIPDRQIGKNYYSMCEWNTQTSSWDPAPADSVYVFGTPAFCSAPDCENSDFADKMGPTAIDKLYFTVVTGTSVGFGDMSPASDKGRLLIALHGVLMLVLGAL